MSKVHSLDSTFTFFALSDCSNRFPSNTDALAGARARLAASHLRYQRKTARETKFIIPGQTGQ